MAAPSTAITRLDLSHSYHEFSLEANRLGFVGLQVMPPVGVHQETGDFKKVEVAQLLKKVETTERKAKGKYSRDDYQWTTDSYNVKEHGVEETVDDATIERYDDVMRAEGIHTARGVNRMLQALENEIAALQFNATTYSGKTTGASVAWTTPATAVPITDIDNAIRSVKTQCGMRPNALVLTEYALMKLKRTAQVEDLLKYSGRDDPKNLGIISGLQALFGLEKIIVADGVKNTADGGQSVSFSSLWNETMALVCHINDDGMDGDLESPRPNIGRTIWSTKDGHSLPGSMSDGEGSLIIEEYREEDSRGGILRFRNKREVKQLHTAAGFLITAVTA